MQKAPMCIAIAVLACGGACKKSAVVPEDDSVDEVVRTSDLDLPASSHAGTLHDAPTKIVIGRKLVFVFGDRYRVAKLPPDPALGLVADDKRNGRADLFVMPLAHALRGARALDGGATDAGEAAADDADPTDVLIVADRRTTYRVLAEVLYTARQSQYAAPAIAFVASTGIASIPLSTMTSPKGLAVVVSTDGISISIDKRHIGRGCKQEGPGVTIGKDAAGEYDWAALTACAKHLKDTTPEVAKDKSAHVGAEGSVELHSILGAIDALHGDTETGDLFTDVALIAPVAEAAP